MSRRTVRSPKHLSQITKEEDWLGSDKVSELWQLREQLAGSGSGSADWVPVRLPVGAPVGVGWAAAGAQPVVPDGPLRRRRSGSVVATMPAGSGLRKRHL